MFTDAEGYERYPELLKTSGKRCLPKRVLPFNRQTSKPDLVVFPGTQEADVDDKRANKKAFREQQTVHLIEVGYTGDYGVHARVAHRLTQQKELQANLLNHGWKEVHMHAFVVSHTGIQPQSNMAALQALQVDDANSLLAAVHMHSVDTCYSILHSYQRELTQLKQLQDCWEKQPTRNSLPLGHTKTRTRTAQHLARSQRETSTTGTHAQVKVHRPTHRG